MHFPSPWFLFVQIWSFVKTEVSSEVFRSRQSKFKFPLSSFLDLSSFRNGLHFAVFGRSLWGLVKFFTEEERGNQKICFLIFRIRLISLIFEQFRKFVSEETGQFEKPNHPVSFCPTNFRTKQKVKGIVFICECPLSRFKSTQFSKKFALIRKGGSLLP